MNFIRHQCLTKRRLVQLADASALYEHTLSACLDCIKEDIDNKVNGAEMLYVSEPPPWIVEKAEEENAEKEAAEKLIKSKPKNTRPIKPLLDSTLSPEERLRQMVEKGGTGEGLLQMHAVRLLGIPKHEALLKVKQLIREVKEAKKKKPDSQQNVQKASVTSPKKKEKEVPSAASASVSETPQKEASSHHHEEEKTVIEKSNICWTPQLTQIFCPHKQSMMKCADQKRYTAIVCNIGSEAATTRHADNLAEMKAWDKKMEPERVEYAQEVELMMQKMKKCPWDSVQLKHARMVLNRWRQRGQHLPPLKFSHSAVCQIDWERGPMEPDLAQLPTVTSILSTPVQIPRLVMPCVKTRDLASLNPQKLRDLPPSNVKLLEQDEAIPVLASSSGCPLAIASSALKALIAEDCESQHSYAIPVSVVETYGSEGRQKICYVEKPLPYGKIANARLMKVYTKMLLKATFFRYSTVPQPKRGGVAPSGAPIPNSADLTKSTLPTLPIPNLVNDSSSDSVEDKGADVPMSSLESLLDQCATAASTSQTCIEDTPLGETNRQYTVMRLGQNSMPILVVSNGGVRHPNQSVVTVDTKLEFLPNCGALKMCDEEWLQSYMKYLVHGARDHIVFRSHYWEPILLMKEHMRGKMQAFVDLHTKEKSGLLCARTRRVSNLVDELISLMPGNYLIVKEGNAHSLRILPHSTDAEEETINIRDLLSTMDNGGRLPSKGEYYHGLDPHRVLQWQSMMGRAPCTFLPPDHPTVKFLKAKWRSSPSKRPGKAQRKGGQERAQTAGQTQGNSSPNKSFQGVKKRKRSRGKGKGNNKQSDGHA